MERAVCQDTRTKREITREEFVENITKKSEKEACQAVKDNIPVEENSEVSKNKSGELPPAIKVYHGDAPGERRRDQNI